MPGEVSRDFAILFFYYMSSGHQTQVVRLDGKHVKTLNYVTGPSFCFLNVASRKVKSHMLLT